MKTLDKDYKMKVTPEQSRAVQEACFARGIEWRLGAEVRHTDEPYLLIGTTIRFNSCMECFINTPAEEIAPEDFITLLNDDTHKPKGHSHAELMAQYAQDAAETETPWERWEYYSNTLKQWTTCVNHPNWDVEVTYRRKSDTIKVGRHEFPRPMQTAPTNNTRYWYVALCDGKFEARRIDWTSHTFDHNNLSAGICHHTKDAAEQHAAVLNAINRGDVE